MQIQFLLLYIIQQTIMLRATCNGNSVHHQPHFFANRSIIVHLFEWTFLDIADECRTFLGPKGYGGVQLSPGFEHVFYNISGVLHPWWERYETVSYRIISRSGNEADFWTMSRICNDNHVRLYADVNLNNMAALPSIYFNDTSISDVILSSAQRYINISNYNYPDIPYSAKDFHHQLCYDKDLKNIYNLRNCQRNGRPDLNHTNDSVKEKLIDMLNHYIKMGVAGFRVDAAKYAWPKDMRYIFDHVDDLNIDFHFLPGSRPFVYYDIFDSNLDLISKTEYSSHGVISEYLYGVHLANIVNGKEPLTTFINWGPALGFISSQNALVFVDGQDTQSLWLQELMNNGTDRQLLTYHQRNKYIEANIFMLAHPFGHIKRIMSSYYYTKTDLHHGPPFIINNNNNNNNNNDDNNKNSSVNIQSPLFDEQNQCVIESGWVCEHRWPIFVEMIAFANYFSTAGQQEERILHFQTNGPNQIAFCRGNKAFIAMNNDPIKVFNKSIYTCLRSGIYCDIITGASKNNSKQLCPGLTLTIDERGYTQLRLPPRDDDYVNNFIKQRAAIDNRKINYGIMIVYVESRIQNEMNV